MMMDRERQTLWAVLGATAGALAGVWLWRQRQAEDEAALGRRWSAPTNAGARVATALRADPSLSQRPIEVETFSDGVVELSGRVPDRDEAGRAVRVAQNTAGVYTVVNRLVVDAEEERLGEARDRNESGDSSPRHTGMGVGMEGRRQSPDTDPDRPSDKPEILDRELDVGTVEDEPDSGPAPISGAEAVESDPLKPGDEAAIREAGLDPSPRPTSTPKRSVPGEDEEAGSSDGDGLDAGAGAESGVGDVEDEVERG